MCKIKGLTANESDDSLRIGAWAMQSLSMIFAILAASATPLDKKLDAIKCAVRCIPVGVSLSQTARISIEWLVWCYTKACAQIQIIYYYYYYDRIMCRFLSPSVSLTLPCTRIHSFGSQLTDVPSNQYITYKFASYKQTMFLPPIRTLYARATDRPTEASTNNVLTANRKKKSMYVHMEYFWYWQVATVGCVCVARWSFIRHIKYYWSVKYIERETQSDSVSEKKMCTYPFLCCPDPFRLASVYLFKWVSSTCTQVTAAMQNAMKWKLNFLCVQ